MFNNQETERKLTDMFANKFNVEVPSIDTDLIASGYIDSLMLVELLLHLEQDFGMTISIADLELDHFRTIVSIAEFISTQQGAAAAAQ